MCAWLCDTESLGLSHIRISALIIEAACLELDCVETKRKSCVEAIEIAVGQYEVTDCFANNNLLACTVDDKTFWHFLQGYFITIRIKQHDFVAVDARVIEHSIAGCLEANNNKAGSVKCSLPNRTSGSGIDQVGGRALNGKGLTKGPVTIAVAVHKAVDGKSDINRTKGKDAFKSKLEYTIAHLDRSLLKKRHACGGIATKGNFETGIKNRRLVKCRADGREELNFDIATLIQLSDVDTTVITRIKERCRSAFNCKCQGSLF